MSSWEGLQTGLEFILLEKFSIESSRLRHYAWASGDFNTIHFDQDEAKKMGLPGMIAHGMLQLGLMNRALEDLIEQISKKAHTQCKLQSLETKFVGMGVVGEDLQISARIASTTESSFNLHLFVYKNFDRAQLTCLGTATITSDQV